MSAKSDLANSREQVSSFSLNWRRDHNKLLLIILACAVFAASLIFAAPSSVAPTALADNQTTTTTTSGTEEDTTAAAVCDSAPAAVQNCAAVKRTSWKHQNYWTETWTTTEYSTIDCPGGALICEVVTDHSKERTTNCRVSLGQPNDCGAGHTLAPSETGGVVTFDRHKDLNETWEWSGQLVVDVPHTHCSDGTTVGAGETCPPPPTPEPTPDPGCTAPPGGHRHESIEVCHADHPPVPSPPCVPGIPPGQSRIFVEHAGTDGHQTVVVAGCPDIVDPDPTPEPTVDPPVTCSSTEVPTDDGLGCRPLQCSTGWTPFGGVCIPPPDLPVDPDLSVPPDLTSFCANGRVHYRWGPVAGAVSYQVYGSLYRVGLSTVYGFYVNRPTLTEAVSSRVLYQGSSEEGTILTTGFLVRARVRAMSATGRSAYSSSVDGVCSPSSPANPTVVCAWSRRSGVPVSYRLHPGFTYGRQTSATGYEAEGTHGFAWSLGHRDDSNYGLGFTNRVVSWETLSPGDLVEVRLRATTPIGPTLWSQVVSSTCPSQATDLVVSCSSGHMSASWDPAAGSGPWDVTATFEENRGYYTSNQWGTFYTSNWVAIDSPGSTVSGSAATANTGLANPLRPLRVTARVSDPTSRLFTGTGSATEPTTDPDPTAATMTVTCDDAPPPDPDPDPAADPDTAADPDPGAAPAAPAAPPAGLSVDCTASLAVDVRWDPVADADSYEVEGDLAYTGVGTSFTSTGTPGVAYQVRARSVSIAEGAGAWTAYESDTCPAIPPVPDGLRVRCTANSQGGLTVRVSWNAADGATSYEVEGDLAYTGVGTAFTSTGAAYDTYAAQVRAVGAGGESALSSTARGTCPPPTPTAVAAVCVNGTLTVSWTDPDPRPSNTYLLLLVIEEPGSTATYETPTSPASPYTWSGTLPAGTEVTAQVSTSNGSYSGFSDEATSVCPAIPPTPQNVAMACTGPPTGPQTLTVTWDPPPGSPAYDIWYNYGNPANWDADPANDEPASISNRGQAPANRTRSNAVVVTLPAPTGQIGRLYKVRVQAEIAAGASGWSQNTGSHDPHAWVRCPGIPPALDAAGISAACQYTNYIIEAEWDDIADKAADANGDGTADDPDTYTYQVRSDEGDSFTNSPPEWTDPASGTTSTYAVANPAGWSANYTVGIGNGIQARASNSWGSGPWSPAAGIDLGCRLIGK